MKTFFKKLLYALALILSVGGFISAVVLAIRESAWIPLVGVLVIGGMAAPMVYRLILKLVGDE